MDISRVDDEEWDDTKGSSYWDNYFLELMNYETKIIPLFNDNIELYIILSEKLFDSQSQEVLVSIHKILLHLVNHDIRFFQQIDLFTDCIPPKHILGEAILIILFSQKEEFVDVFNTNFNDLLLRIQEKKFKTKIAFSQIIVDTSNFENNKIIHILNMNNLRILFYLLDETYNAHKNLQTKELKNYIRSLIQQDE